LQVFESWAGELSPAQFREFSLPYLEDICKRVKAGAKQTVPMSVFAKGAHYAIPDLMKTPFDVISLDWTMDVVKVKREALATLEAIGRKRVVFQGNMDPAVLFGPLEQVKSTATAMIKTFLLDEGGAVQDDRIGYICNLGHGIQPETPVESVRVFLETVRDVSTEIFSKRDK
jgi:uroporphyrinogen decarboxylase